jgi:hypothetical protein
MVKNNFIPGRASWLPRNFTMNLIFAYILLIFSNTLAAQVIKKSNQSISFMASVHADDNFPEVLGKSIDFMYERRLWKNLHMKGDVFISNSQIMRGPRDVFYTAVFGGNVDAYGNYWVGQTSRSFFEMESYILNRTLFQLGVNYRFGKRNQFIPEVGISMGSGYRASINVFEVAVERDTEIIRYARSRSNFLRRRLSGYYVGFSYAIHIKNSVFIQPTMRFYDINNRPNLFNGGAILNGASLGVTIRKDLFPVAKKRN